MTNLKQEIGTLVTAAAGMFVGQPVVFQGRSPEGKIVGDVKLFSRVVRTTFRPHEVQG